MKKFVLQNVFTMICIIILIQGISKSVSLSSENSFLGVSPEDENYYKGLSSREAITCKDGSKRFNKSQFNDDFCDCPDGSDEPGTSACPNGKFFCKNTGHTPLLLYSSRVNDGICDCCDGSDEYNNKIKCPNTCWEAGKVARDKLKKKITTYQEGITIRKQEVEQAKLSIAKEESELSRLKCEEKVLSGLVQQLKEHKERIDEAEEKQRLQKEKEEKERKEAEGANGKEFEANEKSENIENEQNDAYYTIDKPSEDSTEGKFESVLEPKHSEHVFEDGEGLPRERIEETETDSLQNSEQKSEDPVDEKADFDVSKEDENVAEDTESVSREELGRLVASRWTGEKNEQPTEEIDAAQDKDQTNLDEKPSENNDEEYNGYDSEDEAHEYDGDDSVGHADNFEGDVNDDSSSSYKPESDDESDISDLSTAGKPSWLEKIQHTVMTIFKAVNLFQTPIDKSDAARIRKEYVESSSKLSKLQSRISSLTKKLKQDFGQDKEFHSFYGQCFENKQNKYTYKVCPFKEASQVEGYSTTRLGNWDKFEDSYRVMQFSNGEKCWNGPDRSLKVKLRCGLKNEITDIDEPSRCEYLALLSTPALCLDSKLKELEEKLESLNKQQPIQMHDEL